MSPQTAPDPKSGFVPGFPGFSKGNQPFFRPGWVASTVKHSVDFVGVGAGWGVRRCTRLDGLFRGATLRNSRQCLTRMSPFGKMHLFLHFHLMSGLCLLNNG